MTSIARGTLGIHSEFFESPHSRWPKSSQQMVAVCYDSVFFGGFSILLNVTFSKVISKQGFEEVYT